ncbi:hypothetical protein EC912_10868 [Luteibacter rhizovicinus]|uniref:Uncharacterized protein n=1 Tax=Luteibacter rhizovicinus TaxID=242606 RepID=A0A4R3YIN8_9GAMM|nr:hypothetical protein [Luteibacter rhizovicinus]TCV92076.1 hypothetical protein EC912_10868 [Luteibacter rhizovicinus]
MRSSIQLLLAGLLSLPIIVLPAMADGAPPSTGLGQAWPNAADVSASPHYHVYVFERLGVRYVQVNDLNGTVHGAFAYSGSDIMGLPIGVDAARLATPTEPLSAPPATGTTAGEIVYRDASVTISVQPQADGTALMQAVSNDCKNPAECSVHFQ